MVMTTMSKTKTADSDFDYDSENYCDYYYSSHWNCFGSSSSKRSLKLVNVLSEFSLSMMMKKDSRRKRVFCCCFDCSYFSYRLNFFARQEEKSLLLILSCRQFERLRS